MKGKFKCVRKDGSESFTVVLEPMHTEGDAFFVDLPHGTIAMGPLSMDAGAPFAVGDEYFVEFTRAGAAKGKP